MGIVGYLLAGVVAAAAPAHTMGAGDGAGPARSSSYAPVSSIRLDRPTGGAAVQAQGQVIGRVTEQETGAPVPAVQVVVRGTDIGTLSDDDGRFTLNDVPAGTHTIVAQRLGYGTQEVQATVTAGETTTLNLSMAQTALSLDEIVVVGYGTQQRREVTGSVVSIRGADLLDVPAASFESALQGRLAGVNVAESTGEPGAAPQLVIRGVGSISAGNAPLYVIDGLPYSLNLEQQGLIDQQNPAFGETRANPLANLNPNDIESIEILKDAAAAAIYGSRGSNGVILVTTKRGQFDSAPEISFRSYTGVQTAFNRPRLMNAAEHIEYVKLSRNNSYLFNRDPLNPASPSYNPLYDPDTNAGREEHGAAATEMIPEAYVDWDGTDVDWLDAVLDPAVLHNYNMSVRGGGSDVSYFLSGSYMNQSGVIDGSSFERLGLKANVAANVTERLRLDLDVNAAFGDHDRKQAHAPYFGTPPGIIYSAMVASPAVRMYDDDGSYLQQGPYSINDLGNGMTTTNHPLAARDFIDDKLQTTRVFGNVAGTYSILDRLDFRSMFGYDVDNNRRHFYQGTLLQYRGSLNPDPYAQSSSGQSYNWIWENTLTHSGSIGERHRFNTLIGYTAQRQFDENHRVIARNFPDDQVKTINAGEVTGGGQGQSEWSLVSMLGRVHYTLLDRYMATLTIRSDRSSRFGWDNQTGIFPSVSVGWDVTAEPFMRSVDLFSHLKPRVSYGVAGNFAIPNYGSIGLVTSDNYVFGDALAPGATLVTLGNRDLTWETTEQFNVGLDVGLVRDRIYGVFDYYVSNTRDLLLNVNVPSSTGFAAALVNIGKVQNKGFEAQVSSRNLVGDFQWSTDFSFSTNSNVVKKLGPEGDPILSAGAAGVRHITRVGGEVGAYYGYVHDGIYMTQADLDNAPVDLEGNVALGDIRFKDINGDGVIDANDRTELGSYNPDFMWGLTNRFSWRDFDLSVFFQGVVGREILNLTRRHLAAEGNFNHYANLIGRYWRSPDEPGDGWHPKPDRNSHGNAQRPSNLQIEDGSYVNLKNITVGYNVPPRLLGRFASRARLFASVNNVYMWTDYWGWNPEASIQFGGLTPGEDYGAYPLMRAFQLGIDVTL